MSARLPARVVVAALVAALGVLLGPLGTAPAHAHAELVTSTPERSAVVSRPTDVVRLVFDSALRDVATQVVLTGPRGVVATGAPRIRGAVLELAVAGFPVAGRYQVSWRVVAADDHPETGSLAFTVAAGAVRATAAAPASGSSVPPTAVGPGRSSAALAAGGTPAWTPWALFAAALVLAASAPRLVLARRRAGRAREELT